MSALGKILSITLHWQLACLSVAMAANAAAKAFCYYYHNCPDDGKLPKNGPPQQYPHAGLSIPRRLAMAACKPGVSIARLARENGLN